MGAEVGILEHQVPRLVNDHSGSSDQLFYVNLRKVTEAVVAALDPEDRGVYRENVEAYLEPLRAILFARAIREGVSRYTIVLTVE